MDTMDTYFIFNTPVIPAYRYANFLNSLIDGDKEGIKGRIYKLTCNITNEQYIGSTKTTLYKRLLRHEDLDTNNTSSREIIKRGNYKIELIDELIYKDKSELLYRERYHIYANKCVNKCKRPLLYPEEREQIKIDKVKSIYIFFNELYNEKKAIIDLIDNINPDLKNNYIEEYGIKGGGSPEIVKAKSYYEFLKVICPICKKRVYALYMLKHCATIHKPDYKEI